MTKISIYVFLTLTVLFCGGINLFGQARLIPIAEGWAKNQVNSVIFRKNSVTSFGNDQYVAFYDGNSKVVIAKRKLGSVKWQIVTTPFSGDTTDAHRSISIAVDGRGFLHLSWNHHNSSLHYSRSLTSGSLDFSPEMPMTGEKQNKVTYPEFYNLPNGDLLFLYRDGSSGNGSLVLNGYDAKTQKWLRLQNNLIDGEGERNAYPQAFVDIKGTIHLSWVWRESSDVATNHDLCYARSTDGGKTWQKSTGENYGLPVNARSAEFIWRIPQKSELINQTSMSADETGRPYIATYWRPANSMVPQYQLVYFDGVKWNLSQVSNRKTAFSLSGTGTRRIPMARPQMVIDKNKVIVIFRDEERGSRVSAAVCNDIRKCAWQTQDLAEQNVGMWEPSFDLNLWNKRKMLNIFTQKVGQGDGEKVENIPPQMISILEWRP